MKYYISIDGGGSKLALLLFDENLRPISYATSLGVNPHFYTTEQIRSHCLECFADLLKHSPTKQIDGVYGADLNLLKNTISIVSELADFKEFVQLSEGLVGLLSNGLYPNGIVALSGTGSEVFYICGEHLELMSGGLGALLGDDGSGFTIGREGIRSALAAETGLGDPTSLSESLKEFLSELGSTYPENKTFERVLSLYELDNTVAKIASFSRQVGQAAHNCDILLYR